MLRITAACTLWVNILLTDGVLTKERIIERFNQNRWELLSLLLVHRFACGVSSRLNYISTFFRPERKVLNGAR